MAVYPIILWDSLFLDGTPTAGSTAAGYSVLNISDYREYTYWQAAAAGTNYVRIDLGTSTHTADCVAFIHHNFYSINATVKIQSSTDSTFSHGASNTLLSIVATDNYAILQPFTAKSDRWWQILIETTGIPEFAICLLGTRMTFPSIPTAPLDIYSKGMEILTEKSKSGFILGSIVKYKPIELSFSFPPALNNYSWWNGSFKTFWNNHGSEMKPFFFSLDTTNFPADIFYVTVKEGQSFKLNMSSTNQVEHFTLQMQGVAET